VSGDFLPSFRLSSGAFRKKVWTGAGRVSGVVSYIYIIFFHFNTTFFLSSTLSGSQSTAEAGGELGIRLAWYRKKVTYPVEPLGDLLSCG
jgi:hypothetical protein